MHIEFNDVLVTDVFSGTSKNGNAYGKVSFLSDDSKVYTLFLNAAEVKALQDSGIKPRDTVDFEFEVSPSFRGGIKLNLSSFSLADEEQ